MRLAVVIGLALAAVAAPAAEARSRTFQTPSKKIACRYDSSPSPRLRCDVLWLNDVAFTLTRTGRAHRRHITDTVANPRAKVLAYGRFLDVGPFTCTSRRSGLTCRSRRSGHGFSLSRKRQQAFWGGQESG